MAYFECPSCGKTALRVAHRCPHCGLNFTADMIPPAEPRRLRGLWVVVGALVASAVVVVVARNRMDDRPPPAPARPAAEAVTPPIRVESPTPAPDSAVDSTPEPAAAPPQEETAPVPAPTAAAAGDQLRRYATTWVNVRERRGPNATPVRVLEPGEAVLVDSLAGGWYRVVLDGQPIGYAYYANLGETAP